MQRRKEELQIGLRSFSARYQLTPREAEVLGLLCDGKTRIKEIAEHLSLSPNTVNNHINSIFAKTKSRSKSELLSLILDSVLKTAVESKVYFKRPRVLFFGELDDRSSQLIEFLREREVMVDTDSVSENLNIAIHKKPYDFVFLDFRTTQFDWQKIFSETQFLRRYSPKFLVLGDSKKLTRSEIQAAGCVDIVDVSQKQEAYASMLFQYVDTNLERHAICGGKEIKGVCVNLKASPKTVGYGGLFVPSKDLSTEVASKIEMDRVVRFELEIDGIKEPVRGAGQIVWIEPKGFGMRFVEVADSDFSRLNSFSYKNKIHSFIPAPLV